MTKLYCIHPSTNPDEVGAYPQIRIDGPMKPYNVNGPNAILKIPSEGVIPFTPLIPDFKLEETAKWTDYFNSSYSAHHLVIISNKFFQLVSSSVVGTFDVFPALIREGTKETQYYLFRLMHSKHNVYVNWDTTKWSICYQDQQTHDLIEDDIFFAKSYKNLIEIRKELRKKKERKSIKLKQLVLYPNIDFNDIFYLKIKQSLVVTESLKNKIEVAQLTGVKFVELPYTMSTKNST